MRQNEKCIDTLGRGVGGSPGLYKCHGGGGNQVSVCVYMSSWTQSPILASSCCVVIQSACFTESSSLLPFYSPLLLPPSLSHFLYTTPPPPSLFPLPGMVHDVNKGDKTRGTLSGVTGFICRSVDVYLDLRGPALGTQLHETTCSQVSRLTNIVKSMQYKMAWFL